MGFTLTAGRDGIHLSGAAAGASAIIDGNTIRRTGRQGIHLDQGSIGRIANNVIEDVPGEGIYVLESSNARIGFLIADLGPNTIRNTGTHGIVLRGGSSAWIVGNHYQQQGQRDLDYPEFTGGHPRKLNQWQHFKRYYRQPRRGREFPQRGNSAARGPQPH
jgi:hypothetical protein